MTSTCQHVNATLPVPISTEVHTVCTRYSWGTGLLRSRAAGRARWGLQEAAQVDCAAQPRVSSRLSSRLCLYPPDTRTRDTPPGRLPQTRVHIYTNLCKHAHQVYSHAHEYTHMYTNTRKVYINTHTHTNVCTLMSTHTRHTTRIHTKEYTNQDKHTCALTNITHTYTCVHKHTPGNYEYKN